MYKLKEDDIFVCKKEYINPHKRSEIIKKNKKYKIYLYPWERNKNDITYIFIKDSDFDFLPGFANGESKVKQRHKKLLGLFCN